jgi:hypothetical protein
MRDVIRPFNARMSVPLRPEVRNLYADGDRRFFVASGKWVEPQPSSRHQ